MPYMAAYLINPARDAVYTGSAQTVYGISIYRIYVYTPYTYGSGQPYKLEWRRRALSFSFVFCLISYSLLKILGLIIYSLYRILASSFTH